MAADKFVPHHKDELEKLLELASQAKSILEIGSRYGHTLNLMCRTTVKKMAVSVDLPGVFPWGEDSESELRKAVSGLRDDGYEVHLFIGDSRDENIIKSVRNLGPFDLVLIDGDHRFEGVKTDFENYGDLGKVVVFHDIIKPKDNERQELEVWRFWESITGNKEDFVGQNSKMGLGILRD